MTMSRQQFVRQLTRSESLDTNVILREVLRTIPLLEESKYKGQAGKIAVIGGCREFTGAPWFAAMSALRVGADLSHVFCTQGAATVIKSYSPEIIVHPYLKESNEVKNQDEEMSEIVHSVGVWLSRFDCLVIGPGMGRDSFILDTVKQIMTRAREAQMAMVVDADGLFLVAKYTELVKGYSKVILTPNLNEYQRLARTLSIALQPSIDERSKMIWELHEIADALDGPVIVSKGPYDAIGDGSHVVMCEGGGTPRRCGGQGDVLSGSLAVFATWALQYQEQAMASGNDLPPLVCNPLLIASYGACLLVRTTARETFAERKRSMVAGDIVNKLGQVFDNIYDSVKADPKFDDWGII